jgi:hypothetical protein
MGVEEPLSGLPWWSNAMVSPLEMIRCPPGGEYCIFKDLNKLFPVAYHQKSLDHRLKFPYVSRPMVRYQPVHDTVFGLQVLLIAAGVVFIKEVVNQRWDIFGPVAKRWNIYFP